MKIDVFAHLLPPRYLQERNSRADGRFASQYAKYYTANRGLTDVSLRFAKETNPASTVLIVRAEVRFVLRVVVLF